MISAIASVLNPLMEIIYRFCGNFGLTILLFTLLTKIILLPLSIWVHCNGLKVVRMQPELNRLKAEHYGDADAIADGQAALYKKKKYNPLISLIPLAVQLIILMGVVEVIRHPGFPVRDMYFLGLDLSIVASGNGIIYLLIPLATGASALFLSLVQNRLNPLQKEQKQGMQWGTLVFSVGLSLYLGYFVPAGVALYWIAGNLLAIVQQILLNRAINPEKHVDYEALEKSRQRLKELEALDAQEDKDAAKELAKREKKDEKRFFSVGGKHLVFYSEGQGFYKYFAPVIREIIDNSDLTVHYITSDPKDRIFRISAENPRIQAYYIGPKRLVTVFMKMDAEVVVMTMSDLENYYYKRSYVKKDIRYIYMFHYPLSTHMVLHTGALDHYDEILCVGAFQIPEIRKAEELGGLPPKQLEVCGYCQLDELYKAYQKMNVQDGDKPRILVAPSWQEGNILDSCVDDLLRSLTGHGWRITVRPHPEYMKRYRPRMEELMRRWEGHDPEELYFETDFTSNESIYASDAVITDWSGTATEFSFVTLKPCVFVDTPPKVNNPDYVKLGIEPQELRLRDLIGIRVSPEAIGTIGGRVEEILQQKEQWKTQIREIRTELIANFPESSRASAREILRAVMEQQYPSPTPETEKKEEKIGHGFKA